jgi:hypothetical protein
MKKIPTAISAYMAHIGSKGGKGNSTEQQRERATNAWAKLSPAERSAEMKRRALVRNARKKEEEEEKALDARKKMKAAQKRRRASK